MVSRGYRVSPWLLIHSITPWLLQYTLMVCTVHMTRGYIWVYWLRNLSTVVTPYASAIPEFVSSYAPGIYPLPLHTLVWAHITHTQVACPVLCMAVLLTITILLLWMIASLSWSVWACGWMLLQRFEAQVLSGVVSLVAIGVFCYCRGWDCITGTIGNCIWMLLDSSVGVTRSVPFGADAALGLSWYLMCISNCCCWVKAIHSHCVGGIVYANMGRSARPSCNLCHNPVSILQVVGW